MATVEATTQKVQRILTAEFTNIMLAEKGFSIEYGSTRVFIEIREWTPDDEGNPRSTVYVWAIVARQVKPTPELYHWAATKGQQMLFGGVTVIDADDGTCFVQFDNTLLGDFLDPLELTTAVYTVTLTADDLDEFVHTEFGGKRYTDE